MAMMTPTHDRWDEFYSMMEGPAGCNFREESDGIHWDCSGEEDRPIARKILAQMGLTPGEIQDSLNFFSDNGGHCDCEILLNVPHR